MDANGLRDVAFDDATVTLRLLSDRREELVASRTQAIRRLHRLLAELVQRVVDVDAYVALEPHELGAERG